MQLWPIPASTRRRFLEDAAASGGPEGPGLQGVGLVIALGDASITEQQAAVGGLAKLSLNRCWTERLRRREEIIAGRNV